MEQVVDNIQRPEGRCQDEACHTPVTDTLKFKSTWIVSDESNRMPDSLLTLIMNQFQVVIKIPLPKIPLGCKED